jgi:hypothetical protein
MYGLERRYCSCGEIQERKHDKIPHTEGEWTYDKEKNRLVITCTECDKILKTDSLENHNHSFGEYVLTAKPTCTEKGLQVRHCQCGASQEISIAALGHSFCDWIVKVPPECEKEGTLERICELCQENETQSIDPLSHTLGDWIVMADQKQYPCIYCDKILHTEDLVISQYLDIQNGSVIGLGSCEDKEICIPNTHFDSTITSIEESAFEYQQISGLILSSSITSIEERAFYQCSKLSNVHFGNSLISIAEKAFFKCIALKSVILPYSLIYLGEHAFANCTNLEKVYLGSQISELKMRVFADCKNLKEIHFNGTIDEWNSIPKDAEWDLGTADYTVYCTDGKIIK